MELSLRALGSYAIQQQVLKDIEDLIKTCKFEGLIPIHLSVGPVFIEIGCAHSVRSELKIKDWPYQVHHNSQVIMFMFKEHILETYKSCDRKSGVFDKTDSVVIFFDPDEEYITLYVANPNRKKKKNEPTNKDGHPIEKLKYEPEDILAKFDGLKVEQ